MFRKPTIRRRGTARSGAIQPLRSRRSTSSRFVRGSPSRSSDTICEATSRAALMAIWSVCSAKRSWTLSVGISAGRDRVLSSRTQVSIKTSFLAMRSGRSPGRRPRRSIAGENRLEVEELVPRFDLEVDPTGRVVVDEQLPIAEDAVDEIHWGVVEDHHLNGDAHRSFEIRLEVEREPLERSRRSFTVQNGDVDVACRRGGSSRLAAEQVDCHDPRRPGREEATQRGLDTSWFHTSIIAVGHTTFAARRARAPTQIVRYPRRPTRRRWRLSGRRGLTLHTSIGVLGRRSTAHATLAGGWRCRVARSNAYARRMSAGSLHARPRKVRPTAAPSAV